MKIVSWLFNNYIIHLLILIFSLYYLYGLHIYKPKIIGKISQPEEIGGKMVWKYYHCCEYNKSIQSYRVKENISKTEFEQSKYPLIIWCD